MAIQTFGNSAKCPGSSGLRNPLGEMRWRDADIQRGTTCHFFDCEFSLEWGRLAVNDNAVKRHIVRVFPRARTRTLRVPLGT